ncbi:MAG: hypothetical protein ACFE8U_17365, partial [Candidatus Hermodarchaeota archaeon]
SKFGPWYGWRSSNLEDFRQSIKFLQQFIQENGISIIIPSHSIPIEDKSEVSTRLSDFYNIIDIRKKKILDFIIRNPGTTLNSITDQSIIYQGKQSEPSFVFKTFEYFHVEHHLKELNNDKSIYIENNKIYSN